MTQPMRLPGPGSDDARPARSSRRRSAALASALAVIAGTVLLGVVAGLLWGLVAPRAMLMMSGPGEASLINVETGAYVAADGVFVVITVAGGVVSGVLGYLFAVRRHGPAAMAAVLVGAVVAAYLARWVGEQSGLATFHHLLATLPTGARLRDSLTLGAGSAIAFWPLATGAAAGGMEALGQRAAREWGADRAAPGALGS